MKAFIDFIPVLAFFAVYQLASHHPDWIPHNVMDLLNIQPNSETFPVMMATAIAIVATVLQLIYMLGKKEKISANFWMSTIIVVVFGSLTLYFGNGLFIQWKPTILYWLFAAILIVGRLRNKNYIKTLMKEAHINMADAHWNTLCNIVSGLFLAIGVVNLAVVYTCSMDTWVNFKLFGLMGFSLVLMAVTMVFVLKYSTSIENKKVETKHDNP